MCDMFRPCLRHHQALVKNTDPKNLTHKMQNWISIAYIVCEVKYDENRYLDRIISSTNFNAQFSLFINNMFVTLLSSTCFEH